MAVAGAGPARRLPALGRPRPQTTGPSRTPSRRSAWATPSCSCWPYGRPATNGSPSCSSWSATGACSPSIPLPGPDFDYQAVGVPADWPHLMTGLRRALEQEQQPGLGLRHLVPEPVPARTAVRVQRRRLRHAELHPHAGHDDPGADRRRRAPERADALGRSYLVRVAGVIALALGWGLG